MTLKTVRDVWREMGVDPAVVQVETKEQAMKAIAVLQKYGIKLQHKDGTVIDARFLRNDPDFVSFVNAAILRMMDVPVKDPK